MKVLLFFLVFNAFLFAFNESVAEEEEDEEYAEEGDDGPEDDIPVDRVISLEPLQTLVDRLWSSEARKANGSVESLERLHFLFSQSLDAIFRTLLPFVSENILQTNLSSACLRTLLRMSQDFRQQKEYVFRFVDASARFPFSGLLDGTIADFGEYDECLAIEHREADFAVRGQYCLASLALPMPALPPRLHFHAPVLPLGNDSALRNTFWAVVAKNANLFYISRGLRLALCVPDSCHKQEIQTLLASLFRATLGLHFSIGHDCQTRDSRTPLTSAQIASIVVLSVVAVVVFVATFADVVFHSAHTLITCFSVRQNARKLFLSSTTTSRLSAIHGLRVLSIAWILVGHVYLMQFFQVFHVLRRSVEEMPRLALLRYQPLKLGSFLQVETFLFLGGVTASFVTLEVTSRRKRPFDWFAFLVFRWLRYTPALVGLLLLYFLLPLCASGPIFAPNIHSMYAPCERFFWRNLLYVNNFYDDTGNCATHTWYLAVDFQLYAVSPLAIFAFKRRPLFGVVLTLLLVGSGALLALLPPLLSADTLPAMYSMDTILSDDAISHHFRLLYWGAWQHVSPYFMGVLVGFVAHSKPRLRIPAPLNALLWCACAASALLTVFWTTDWMDSTAAEETPSRAQRLLFTATHKITWTVFPAWIVVTTALGQPGPVGRFLSSHWFVPLSRLTYCLYLVQLIPIVLSAYSVRYVTPFDDFANWSKASFCLLLSLSLAFILFVCFESPFNQLLNTTIKARDETHNNHK